VSFNLVDLIKDQVSGSTLGQIGSLLGENSTNTQAGLDAAIPGLLNGLTQSAKSDGGASLFNTVRDTDDSLLDNMGSLFDVGQSSNHIDKGSNLLSSILGSGALGTLGSVISKVSGIGGRSSSNLLGMLAPIVIGIIKRKLFANGSGFGHNAGGLMSLLNGQSNNIQAAMPTGFASELQSAGFNDNPTGVASSTTASSHGHAAGNATPAPDGGWMRKFLPIAAVLAVALIGWNFLKGGADKAADTVSDTAGAVSNATTETASAAAQSVTEGAKDAGNAVADAASGIKDALPSVMVGDRDFGAELGGIFHNATETVSGITDIDTAKSALPKLSDIGTSVDGLSGLWDQLPDAGKGTISELTNQGMGTLDGALQKVNALDGVGDVIKPAVGPLLEKLKMFSGQ